MAKSCGATQPGRDFYKKSQSYLREIYRKNFALPSEAISFANNVLNSTMDMSENITVPKDYLEFLQKSFPAFWEMKTAVLRLQTVKQLKEFYAFVLSEGNHSSSQLFQDVFVDFVFQKSSNKRFLEFGATNGHELSNSFMLEQHRGWWGVLAEPDPQWHMALKENRPNSTIITDCIYSRSGESMRFISSSNGVLSSLKDFCKDDANGPLTANAKQRLQDFKEIEVKTISLDDVFELHFNGEPIEYMSVDTEGSEFEILSKFNFSKYHPSVVTVEHNYTDKQKKIDELFSKNGYTRVFSVLTNFDAWYVRTELAAARGFSTSGS